jgi:hypothetical protein
LEVGVSIPRLVLPLRIAGNGHLAEAEQGSINDDFSRVESALRTRIGAREDNLPFGTSEAAFQPLPFDTGRLLGEIERSAPGALASVEERPDRFDALMTSLSVQVSDRG